MTSGSGGLSESRSWTIHEDLNCSCCRIRGAAVEVVRRESHTKDNTNQTPYALWLITVCELRFSIQTHPSHKSIILINKTILTRDSSWWRWCYLLGTTFSTSWDIWFKNCILYYLNGALNGRQASSSIQGRRQLAWPRFVWITLLRRYGVDLPLTETLPRGGFIIRPLCNSSTGHSAAFQKPHTCDLCVNYFTSSASVGPIPSKRLQRHCSTTTFKR